MVHGARHEMRLSTQSLMHMLEPIGINYNIIYADVAQLAEQLTCNQQVIGSSPIVGLQYD